METVKRRRNLAWTTCAVALVVLASTTSAAQDKPDFSGHWILETPAPSGADVPRALTIRQSLVRTNVRGEPVGGSEIDMVKEKTQEAIAAVLNGERWVDLPPGPSLVRRLEHEMARQAELVSHSYGKEPRRHVRIFRE